MRKRKEAPYDYKREPDQPFGFYMFMKMKCRGLVKTKSEFANKYCLMSRNNLYMNRGHLSMRVLNHLSATIMLKDKEIYDELQKEIQRRVKEQKYTSEDRTEYTDWYSGKYPYNPATQKNIYPRDKVQDG